MKISKIHIKDFHQFKDFTLDLIYPQGHEKAGQPLEKVCFIGQSGTGKTSLLELIPMFLYWYNTNLILRCPVSDFSNKNIKVCVEIGKKNEYSAEVYFIYDDKNYNWHWIENPQSQMEVSNFVHNEWKNKISSKLIYFPANLNYDLDLETDNRLENREIIDFSQDKVSTVWYLILEKIQNYQEQELKIRQDISKVVEKSSNDIKAIQEAVKKLEDWKNSEFNPIKDVADNCLDPLLAKFKLRVKTELDFKTKDDIGFIKVEDFEETKFRMGFGVREQNRLF